MTRARFTTENFMVLWETLPDYDKYVLLDYSNIKNCKSKILIKCKKCEHQWNVRCESFITNGTRCRNCLGTTPKYKNNFLEIWCKSINSKNYILLDYNNVTQSKSKFTIQCISCTYIFSISCGNFFNSNRGCPQCANNLHKFTKDNFVQLWNNSRRLLEYDLVDYSNVSNAKSKITVKCKECTNESVVGCSYFLNTTHGCKYCTDPSSGEKNVEDTLLERNISYIRQCKFNNCKNKRELPFDFFLPEYNILIECQGGQHYKSNAFFGGEDGFKERQRNDFIKKEYATKNGYYFLEIHFDDYKRAGEIVLKTIGIIP